MWKLKSCCGFSLKKGSIAIMTVVFPLQIASFLVVVLTTLHFDAKKDSSGCGCDDDDSAEDFVDEAWEAALVSIYIAGTGIYGVIKGKPKKIMKYLMIQAVNLLSMAIAIFWVIINPSYILRVFKLDDTLQVPLILTLILLFVIFLYFFAVVYCHYCELKYKHPDQNHSPADIPLREV